LTISMPGGITQGTHLWVRDIKEDTTVSGAYLVREKRVQMTRAGKPFLGLVLADRTGDIPAKVWDQAESLSPLFKEGDVVQIFGNAGSYRGEVQITVNALEPVRDRPDPEIFLESAPGDPSRMMRSLRGILKGVHDPHLKALIDAFLEDRGFMARFRKAPAAKNFHHGYLGGLLEHTLSVCQMAEEVAAHYPELNRDLLITSAFVHDVGKIRELGCDILIDYTDEGRLVGHVVLGLSMVEEKLRGLQEFPPDLAVRLKHMILSHHGQYDFGSPKEPKFLEAFALHLIDDLDAKINGLSRFMERDRHEGSWTEFNRMFGKYFLKQRLEPAGKERGPDTDTLQGTLFSEIT